MTNSEFRIKMIKRVKKTNSETYKTLFCRELGDDWEVLHQLCRDLKSFTCLMYRDNKTQSLNFLQSKIIKINGWKRSNAYIKF